MKMRKNYAAPEVTFEPYTLDASIAQNCKTVVNNGPEALPKYEQCSNYHPPFMPDGIQAYAVYNVNFYADTTPPCDCYTTGGNGEYWTS